MSIYGSVLALSSSHHPHNGQTEILNAKLEQMLRAYVNLDRSDWAKWLSVLVFAYNELVHSLTSQRLDFLPVGFKPEASVGKYIPLEDDTARPFLPSQKAEKFKEALEVHRCFAKDFLILAQERQARAYNKGHILVKEFNVGLS